MIKVAVEASNVHSLHSRIEIVEVTFIVNFNSEIVLIKNDKVMPISEFAFIVCNYREGIRPYNEQLIMLGTDEYPNMDRAFEKILSTLIVPPSMRTGLYGRLYEPHRREIDYDIPIKNIKKMIKLGDINLMKSCCVRFNGRNRFLLGKLLVKYYDDLKFLYKSCNIIMLFNNNTDKTFNVRCEVDENFRNAIKLKPSEKRTLRSCPGKTSVFSSTSDYHFHWRPNTTKVLNKFDCSFNYYFANQADICANMAEYYDLEMNVAIFINTEKKGSVYVNTLEADLIGYRYINETKHHLVKICEEYKVSPLLKHSWHMWQIFKEGYGWTDMYTYHE